MSEITTQKDLFNEKSKLLDIALKYTNGDIERAKLMVAGQYNDVKIIKGKFDIKDGVAGMFLIFVNLPNSYIMNINTLMLPNDNLISKANIFDSWKAYYVDLIDFTKKETDNALPSYEFNTHLLESLKNYDVYSKIDGDNLDELTEAITEIIGKYHSVANLNCKISLDNSSSLNMELSNIPVEEPKKISADEPSEIDGNYSGKITDIESKADYVINGRVIISPVKGKYINDIKVGEKIKVLLTGSDKISNHVAKSLNAVTNENEILPINIRITEKFPMEKKGYFIYGLAAKNVLVRIIEEENVKIETETTQKIQKSVESEKNRSDSKMILYAVLLVGLLFLFLFFIFIVL